VGLADVVGVFGEDAAGFDGLALFEVFAASGDFAGGDVETTFLGEPDGKVVDYAEIGFYAKGTADGVGD